MPCLNNLISPPFLRLLLGRQVVISVLPSGDKAMREVISPRGGLIWRISFPVAGSQKRMILPESQEMIMVPSAA
jgi:hypothetical protein